MNFSKANVTVQLTGEQWFAIMAKLAGRPLSDKGRTVFRVAIKKLADQVGAASDTFTVEVSLARPEKTALSE